MEKSIPQVDRLYVELSNVCNFKCDFCPSTVSSRERQYMDFDLFKKIVDEVADNRITDTLAFYLLGEPLLSPHLFDAIDYAKGEGLKVEITTNGSLLSREMVKNLTRLKLDILVISVVTVNEKEHESRNSGRSFVDYYSTILETLKLVQQLSSTMRIELRLMSTFTKRFFDVEREIRIGEQKKAFRKDLLMFVEDILSSLDRKASREKIVQVLSKTNLHEEQIIWVYKRIGVFLRPFVDWGNAFTSKKVFPCKIGYCSLAFSNMGVLSNGTTVVCCGDYDGKTSIGNLKHSSMLSLLSSKKARDISHGFKRFRLVHPHCQQCLGASTRLRAFFKGLGSIYFFKFKSANKPKNLSVW